jgi:branched-chain amino acid transport system substrate-binding protein
MMITAVFFGLAKNLKHEQFKHEMFKMVEKKNVSRRKFLNYAATAIVTGAVVGTAGYYAGSLSAPSAAPRTVTTTATQTSVPTVKLHDPIKIGGQSLLSGPWAAYGDAMQKGATMAVDEINAAGGIFGSKLELNWMDEAAGAVANARFQATSYNADFLMGLDTSGDTMAVAPIMPELNKILMVVHGATHRLTEQSVYQNKQIQNFRIAVPVYQDGILGGIVASALPVTKWASISPDYEYGYVAWALFKLTLQALRPDVTFVAESWPASGTLDFSANISAVMASNPEGIFSAEWAGEGATLIKQLKAFGVIDKLKPQSIMMCLGAAMDVLTGLGKDYPEGIWASCRYWFQYPSASDVNTSFVQRYYSKYGVYPHYNSENAYTAVNALKLAIQNAQSLDFDKVRTNLEGLSFYAPKGRTYIRPADHQAIYEVPWGQIKQTTDYPMPILSNLKIFPAEVYYRNPPFPAFKYGKLG